MRESTQRSQVMKHASFLGPGLYRKQKWRSAGEVAWRLDGRWSHLFGMETILYIHIRCSKEHFYQQCEDRSCRSTGRRSPCRAQHENPNVCHQNRNEVERISKCFQELLGCVSHTLECCVHHPPPRALASLRVYPSVCPCHTAFASPSRRLGLSDSR